MGKIKNYTVSLDETVVDQAKAKLKIGQKLSPVLNNLLKIWTKEDNK